MTDERWRVALIQRNLGMRVEFLDGTSLRGMKSSPTAVVIGGRVVKVGDHGANWRVVANLRDRVAQASSK